MIKFLERLYQCEECPEGEESCPECDPDGNDDLIKKPPITPPQG